MEEWQHQGWQYFQIKKNLDKLNNVRMNVKIKKIIIVKNVSYKTQQYTTFNQQKSMRLV